MPSLPDPDDVRKAVMLAHERDRTPADTAFLERFFADHLRPRPGEDPAAHAARLPTPQLFQLYRQLRSEADFAPPLTYALAPASPPAPVVAAVVDQEARAARVLSERAPAASSHNDFVDVDEDYPPAGHQPVPVSPVQRADESPAVAAEEPRSGPRHGPGRPAAEPRGGGCGVRRRVTDFVHGRKRAASLLGAAVAVAAGSYGTMYVINHQAHRAGEPVRQMQQQTGKAAEGLPTDPSRGPIENRSRPASPTTAPEGKGR